MDTKLTLKLNKRTIERAKAYARKRNQSLSKLVEGYFNLVTEERVPIGNELTPLVTELSGVIKLAKKRNPKEDYAAYLIDKYK
jgi:Family of unknown function (DUF6364)